MKLTQGKLYIVKNKPKTHWEVNHNNFIVSMTVPGYLNKIPNYPIMFLGAKKIGLSNGYLFLSEKLIRTFHESFINDLIEL